MIGSGAWPWAKGLLRGNRVATGGGLQERRTIQHSYPKELGFCYSLRSRVAPLVPGQLYSCGLVLRAAKATTRGLPPPSQWPPQGACGSAGACWTHAPPSVHGSSRSKPSASSALPKYSQHLPLCASHILSSLTFIEALHFVQAACAGSRGVWGGSKVIQETITNGQGRGVNKNQHPS